VVAVGGGLYLYKKRRDEEEQWAHLDDDWYYQEDEYVPSHPVRPFHTDRPWANKGLHVYLSMSDCVGCPRRVTWPSTDT
jgi:hypothetical protein